jgi:hypothetical protein
VANYAISNTLPGTGLPAITAAHKTQVAVTGVTASRRIKWYDMSFGTIGTPADQTYEFDVSRQTAAGSSTTVTPLSIDPADGACDAVGTVNFSAEGTTTAASSIFYLGTNQRASYRWVAAPGSELVGPGATFLAGLRFAARSQSGGTAPVTAYILFSE